MSRGKDCDGGLRCIARNLGNTLVAGYEKTLKEEMPLFNEVGSLLSLFMVLCYEYPEGKLIPK